MPSCFLLQIQYSKYNYHLICCIKDDLLEEDDEVKPHLTADASADASEPITVQPRAAGDAGILTSTDSLKTDEPV